MEIQSGFDEISWDLVRILIGISRRYQGDVLEIQPYLRKCIYVLYIYIYVLYMYMYICICIYVYVNMYICIYTLGTLTQFVR